MAKKILFFMILLVAATVFFEVSRCEFIFLPYRSTYNIQLIEFEPELPGRTKKKVIDSLVKVSA